ncbi:conjugal transfer protein MobC [Chitinophaga rhizosphaerae]|uniref:conjugal transfer protein MobC n=1 Tax=Chitinophaga rhizosphaerae TaxID=1864947 RepID=UPI000F80C4A6|nr:conjugal transfer protein MobC [Chitinophaga rhizosphaerae]
MSTGENEQMLRGVIDFVRLCGVLLLGVHLYICCHGALDAWNATSPFLDRQLLKAGRFPVIANPYYFKAVILGLLALTMIANKGKKDTEAKPVTIIILIALGTALYWGAMALLHLDLDPQVVAGLFSTATITGYLMLLSGGARISRLIKVELDKDIFNEMNETFPQWEQRHVNEYSVNLPAKYKLRGKVRDSWINIVAPFRATMIIGSGGAGKSYFVIRHYITQMISKGYTMFVYDFKWPDLSIIAYNAFLKHQDKYPVPPRFCFVNFDDLSRTHRCNVIPPEHMDDIADAAESSRTLLMALNREWTARSGEFFVESPINFVTALIWFLRNYKGGKYCTLPHVIEFANLHYDDLFPILGTDPALDSLVNPFVSAYLNRAMEQLEGQVASAKIALARLVSPSLYYVLSGNDFTLDINNPEEPKVVCVGNNPQRVQTYGAVHSLYLTRLSRLVTKKGKLPSSIIVDELPTVYWNTVPNLIGIARGYRCAITLAIQQYSQLKRDYSKEQAEILLNICGNLFCGQTVGEAAKDVSDRIGKVVQPRDSVSINRNDTSVSKNSQLEMAVPPSRIAQLSSGEFVGLMADTPTEPIKLKAFHSMIQNDHAAIAAEEAAYQEIPVIRNITPEEVNANFQRIKDDINEIRYFEIERIKNDPNLSHLLFIKPGK